MSYAVVMVYVDATGLPEGRVRLAASLADKFNATLIGLSALAIPHPSFLTARSSTKHPILTSDK
jgi:hypothetical protein